MAETRAKTREKRLAKASGAALEQPKAGAPAPPMYAAAELAQAAHCFGAAPEAVIAALKERGVGRATEAEARKIVAAFLERRV